jgi:hypothetical protein
MWLIEEPLTEPRQSVFINVIYGNYHGGLWTRKLTVSVIVFLQLKLSSYVSLLNAKGEMMALGPIK